MQFYCKVVRCDNADCGLPVFLSLIHISDQADKLLEVIKDLLKDPDGNKEMLAPQMCIRDRSYSTL